MRTFVLTTSWVNAVCGLLALAGMVTTEERKDRLGKFVGVLAAAAYSIWGFWLVYGGQ
jgi:hypothetical protein